MSEIPPPADAEVSPTPLTPHQRAQALYGSLPERPATASDYERARRTHECPDGSRVYGADLYGDGSHFKFIVYGPAIGPYKELGESRIAFEFSQNVETGQENLGSIVLPELPVMLGGERIATIPQSRRVTHLEEGAQHVALDWTTGIVENDRYSPLGLTVPER